MYDLLNLNLIIYIFVCIVFIHFLRFFYKKMKSFLFLRKLAKADIKTIDKMDGFQFEVYLKALFKKLGYSPEVTKKSGDFGADLILKGKNKIVIQAKRYQYKNNVSLNAVQQVYAAKAYYKASEAWIVTNSFYTKQAKVLARACDVRLIDRFDLVDMINRINPDVQPQDVLNNLGVD